MKTASLGRRAHVTDVCLSRRCAVEVEAEPLPLGKGVLAGTDPERLSAR